MIIVVVDVGIAHVKQVLGPVAPRQRLVADLEVWVPEIVILLGLAKTGSTQFEKVSLFYGGGLCMWWCSPAIQFSKTPHTATDPIIVIFFHSSTSSAHT